MHAQKILDVINASNADPVLGDVFGNEDLCEDALSAWLREYKRALAHEQRRQDNHCDHVDEPKRALTCMRTGYRTGEVVSTEKYPDPGEALCGPIQ